MLFFIFFTLPTFQLLDKPWSQVSNYKYPRAPWSKEDVYLPNSPSTALRGKTQRQLGQLLDPRKHDHPKFFDRLSSKGSCGPCPFVGGGVKIT